ATPDEPGRRRRPNSGAASSPARAPAAAAPEAGGSGAAATAAARAAGHWRRAPGRDRGHPPWRGRPAALVVELLDGGGDGGRGHSVASPRSARKYCRATRSNAAAALHPGEQVGSPDGDD